MPGLLPDIDPDGLLEYSVVFTDRSLNHMSRTFQGVMNDISDTLKTVYQAEAVVVVPVAEPMGWKQWQDNLPRTRNAWSSETGFSVFGGARFLKSVISPLKRS